MRCKKKKRQVCRAVTLVELVLAMTLIVIIFAVVVPEFRLINNSWDSKQGHSEALQNGRVLIDHINRNLSKAVKITAVSDSSETDGYIEFQDNDGNTLRYDIAGGNYVEFGEVGSLSDLAGPVSKLQFTSLCRGRNHADEFSDKRGRQDLLRFSLPSHQLEFRFRP